MLTSEEQRLDYNRDKPNHSLIFHDLEKNLDSKITKKIEKIMFFLYINKFVSYSEISTSVLLFKPRYIPTVNIVMT